MKTTIKRWGNSLGIRIPKAFLENANFSENEPVDIILENEKIIIKKASLRRHRTIKERLIEYCETNPGQTYTWQKEIDWGKPTGKEIW